MNDLPDVGPRENAVDVTSPDAPPASDEPDRSAGVDAGRVARPVRRRRRLLVGLVVGAVVALLVAGGSIAALAMRSFDQSAPSRAVAQYLGALAEGDADVALSFVPAGVDRSLLTEEVLRRSVELAPITDIALARDGAGVEASFTMGGESVTRSFDVSRDGDGWIIADAVTTVPWLVEFRGVDARVNGAPISGEDPSVFPGAYELTLESPYFALEGETLHTIVSSADTDRFREATVVLSENGAATFTELVSASLRSCLAMTSMTTPCGVDVDPAEVSGTFTEGSAVRTLAAEDRDVLGNLPYIILRREQTVRVGQAMTVDLDFTSLEPDTTWEYEWDGFQLWPQVDFSVEPLQVSWTE